jgi:phosphoglycerate dehydrogenase-like enzyme
MRIAVLDDYQRVARELANWDSLDAELEVFQDPFPDSDTAAARLDGFDVVVAMRERTPFPAHVLRKLDQLKLLVTTGMGNVAIDIAAARELGIVVCGTGYPYFSATSELTWALILSALRKIPAETRLVRDGGWQASVGVGLEGKTLGLLGLGNIGSRVAKVGQAFEMTTIAWSQNLTADTARGHGVTLVSKEELFSASDVVSVHVMLGERTRGLVGAKEIASMKRTAVLVNTSRAPIIDEDALIRALREGTIGGAALDVFSVEPLPAQHPLRALDNAVSTPHIGYVTDGNYEVFYRDVIEDIAAFAAGKPVRVLS